MTDDFLRPESLLTRSQMRKYADYLESVVGRQRRGCLLHLRVKKAQHLTPATVNHCIVWDSPYDDAPLRVTNPNGLMVAQLMKGGIHAPLEAHWGAEILIVGKNGEHATCAQIDAPDVRQRFGGSIAEWVIDYRRVHAEIEGPLTYNKAIEYIVAKDVPHYAWGKRSNRPHCAIIDRGQLPQGRELRNSWRLTDFL